MVVQGVTKVTLHSPWQVRLQAGLAQQDMQVLANQEQRVGVAVVSKNASHGIKCKAGRNMKAGLSASDTRWLRRRWQQLVHCDV